MTRLRWLAVIAFVLYVVAVGWNISDMLVNVQPPHWLLSVNMLFFFVFAVLHANEQLGTRAMLVFLLTVFVVSFVFETVGVLTGAIYGQYYYTHRLGPKLGVVPFLIPIAWFMMMYASYAVAQVIAGKQPKALIGTLWFALLGAMAMTAWDLGMDPQMVARGHWVWVQGGAYFGIPVQNFVGWLATTFTGFLLFRLYENSQPWRAFQLKDRFALMPIAAYAVEGSATIIAGSVTNQPGPALVTFFAMGAFLFAAITRIIASEDRQ